MIDPSPPERDPALVANEDTRFTWFDWVKLVAAIVALAAIILTESRS